MRVEPHTEGSIVHVIKRGSRGMNIVYSEKDKREFARLLYILNDSYQDRNWRRDTAQLHLHERPPHWPERDPLVSILAWTLMPNHFHLLLYERVEGGVSKFIQRLGGSMTLGFNQKYNTRGSIFESAYKGRTVDDDRYLQYVLFYILVKNVFELSPGGLAKAEKNFNTAWEWALAYPFSSLRSSALREDSPILDIGKLKELGLWYSPSIFKKEAKAVISASPKLREDKNLSSLMLEEW